MGQNYRTANSPTNPTVDLRGPEKEREMGFWVSGNLKFCELLAGAL